MALVLRREWWGRAGFGTFGDCIEKPGFITSWIDGATGKSYLVKSDCLAAQAARSTVSAAQIAATVTNAAAAVTAPAAPPAPAAPAALPAAPPPGGVNRQQLVDRFNAARQRALAAVDAYNRAVAHGNRAIKAANRQGAPDAVAFATQAAALVPRIHNKAQAAVEAASAYGKQQGFAGLRGFEGYAWAYGDLADDAGTQADQAAGLLSQVHSLADQAELADARFSPPAAGPTPATAILDDSISTGRPAEARSIPTVITAPSSPISVSVSPSGEAAVSGEPVISRVLLYGGLGVLALLLFKGKSHG